MTKEKMNGFCDRIIEISFLSLMVTVTFSTSLVEIASTLMILVWLVKKFNDRDFGFCKALPVKLLFAYFVWAILSCINSEYAKESFRGIFKIAEYGLLFVIAATNLNKDRIFDKFFYIVSSWSIIIVINGLYQYFVGYDLIRYRTLLKNDYLMRISSSFVHPNDFGVYLLVFLAMFIGILISANIPKKIKYLAGAAAAFSSLGLFMTKSRGALLSFFAAFLVLGALKAKRVLAMFIAVLLVLFILLPYTAQERVFSITDLKEGTTWERLMLWKGTINMIEVHPWLGFGVNTYSRNFPKFKPAEYPDVRYSHNCYLHMASEIGIVGALLFIIFIITTLMFCMRGFQCLPDDRNRGLVCGVFAGLVGFSMNCVVDTHLYSVNLAVFFHLMLGYCFALSSGKQEVYEK